MKKFYAFMLAVLVAAVSFAQGGKARQTEKLPAKRVLPKSVMAKTVKKVAHRPVMKMRKAEAASENYVRVSTAPETWEGQYLIVYEDEQLAMNGGLTEKLDVVGNTIEVAITDQEIAASEAMDAASFTITKVDGGYAIQSASGLYMGQTADANGLQSAADTKYPNVLSVDADGNSDVVAASGGHLRFNAAENQMRFRYYKAATYANQQPVALYKKGGEKTEIAGKGDLVVLPEGLETEPYALVGTMTTGQGADNLNETVQVGFDGETIYVQGLSYWFEEAWAKGTISGDKVLFASNQLMGEDEYGPDYLIGYVDDGDAFKVVENIVFDYDSKTRVLTLNEDNWYGESDQVNGTTIYNYCDDLTLTPGEAEQPEAVVVPEGLTEEVYVIKALGYDYDEEENPIEVPVTAVGRVAFDDANKEVYIQGLCSYLPEAWVKGTVSGDVVTLPTGQYFGVYEFFGSEYDFYFVGTDDKFAAVCDVQFTLSADRKSLTTTNWVITGLSTGLDNAVDLWGNVSLIKPEDKAATPAAPAVTDFADWDAEEGYGYTYVEIPLLDTNGDIMVPEKLSYKLFVDEAGTISEYKFAAELYENLEADMVEVPFLFDDDYDFDRDGDAIFVALNSETASYDRIGVQSIYRGGNAENKSEISWYTIERDDDSGDYEDAIKTVVAPVAINDAIYNLAGQRVEKPVKGLYIQNGKKVLVK